MYLRYMHTRKDQSIKNNDLELQLQITKIQENLGIKIQSKLVSDFFWCTITTIIRNNSLEDLFIRMVPAAAKLTDSINLVKWSAERQFKKKFT